MKNKRIISLILFILGIGLISYGLFRYWDSFKHNEEGIVPSSSHNSGQETLIEDKRTYINITNYSNNNDINKELCFSEFTTKKQDDNSVFVSFDLKNNTGKEIKDKILKLNYYSQEELIDFIEFKIDNLNSFDEAGFETIFELEDQTKTITKYEFEFDSYKVVAKPTEK